MPELSAPPKAKKPLRPGYGIDAPGVIRNLFIAGMAGFILFFFFPQIKIGPVNINTRGFIFMAIGCTAMAIFMLLYALYGKFLHRDRMLNLVTWTGKENILDIGTGKGLVLIGAAKRLTSGKATGIDIWNAEDLTGNNAANAEANAAMEGVSEKITILNEDARKMSFPDHTFDFIFSNLCLHNIYDPAGRKEACQEIIRVLQPGGTAVVSDFRHIGEYKRYFEEMNAGVSKLPANYLTTFPALSILVVKKRSSVSSY